MILKNCHYKKGIGIESKKLCKQVRDQQVDILISKNQALQVLHLKHHNNEYKTS